MMLSARVSRSEGGLSSDFAAAIQLGAALFRDSANRYGFHDGFEKYHRDPGDFVFLYHIS
jgi:hypothetical protein